MSCRQCQRAAWHPVATGPGRPDQGANGTGSAFVGLTRGVVLSALPDLGHGVIRLGVDDLEPTLRLTDCARCRWSVNLEGVPVVESMSDLDRRVRWDHAWRTFAAVATTAQIDPAVHSSRAVLQVGPVAPRRFK